MLPRLQLNADVDPVIVRFLDELKIAGFTGDIEVSIFEPFGRGDW